MANPKKPGSKRPPSDGGGGGGWDVDIDAPEVTPAVEVNLDSVDGFPELDTLFPDDVGGMSGDATGLHEMPPVDPSQPTLIGEDDPLGPAIEVEEVPFEEATPQPEPRGRTVTPPPMPSVEPRARTMTPPPVPLEPLAERQTRPAPPRPQPRSPDGQPTEPGSARGRTRPSRPPPEQSEQIAHGSRETRAMAPPPPEPSAEARAPRARRPDEEPTILNDHAFFRKEGQRLGRTRDWVKLAAITSAAIDEAEWAELAETKAALLVDLAKVYRDRLKDAGAAEQTFRKLAAVDPAHPDAIEFLSSLYREREDWRSLYDLYAGAVEPTWDPNQRLAWTREMVAIATHELRSPDLAIDAWERLWRLGDSVDEAARALSEVYRKAGRWDRLAEFLKRRAAQLEGAERVVALREIAEAYLSGLRDQDQAAEVLEQILAERPGDPIALLALARVLARRKDWEALTALGERPMDGVPEAAILDFRRLVADALWSAGDLERAVVAHERVLELDPTDVDALKAKEEYLTRTGKSAELVQLLAGRAEQTADEEERGKLIARAAEIAEREIDDPKLAISLWEKRAMIEAGRLDAYQALAHLYEAMGDPAGVGRALEGQLQLTRHPGARIELLRRLGDHAAHRLGDDERAEACWREIVTIIPDDKATRDELIALHRRRGDFEALDRTLSGQAWRAVDEQEIVGLWRAAAENADQNIRDARRSVRSWLRVVDMAPADGQALAQLVLHHRALADKAGDGDSRELIAQLEAELLVTPDAEARVKLALEIGRLWEQAEGSASRAAAVAAYQRVLRWRPTDERALSGLQRLATGKNEAGGAIGALDVAAASPELPVEVRIGLLRLGIELLDAGDKLGRFHALKRVLWLSGRDAHVLGEVARAASEAGAWAELAAVYADAAAEAPDEARRAQLHRELAAICERELSDKVRAFLVLQATALAPLDDPAALEQLMRLAEATQRWEDLLALYDVQARAGAQVEARREALRRRAAICERELKDEARAFHECARILALDPGDGKALADARRLAAAKKLWRPLDALYAELWDRTGSDGERLALARARHKVRGEELADPNGALDQLLVAYRIDPNLPDLMGQMVQAADALKAWDRVLPPIEALARSVGEQASPEELHRIAALHEEKRSDPARAFELYAEAFVLRPSWAELKEKLEQLAEKTKSWALLVDAYRTAAARSGDALAKLDLYDRVTRIYTDKLGRADDALDVHRRILQLQPAALPSLEAVIAHHRQAGKWRDLRDRLQQWIERAADAPTPARVERWLEIARISRDHLSDPENALGTYALILEVDPANDEAAAGVRSLTEGDIDPGLELRRLRIELQRAPAARRIEIQLQSAGLQENQLDDLDGAIFTLRELIAETGAAGPGFAPLARLYRQKGSFSDLVDLIEARAAVLQSGPERVEALEQAFAVCDDHPDAASAERKERLYRRMIEERPDDVETRRRLLALYRDAARYQELAELLQASIARLPKGAAGEEERNPIENELGRVLDRGLGRTDEARALYAARAERHPDDAEAELQLASLELRRGDFAGWLALREKGARRAPPHQGALILCHLAEACDEQPQQQGKVANFYREARALDAGCVPAMEALKAIGRRAKSWRAGAAMLPDPDEQKLPWSERAARLRGRGEKAADAGDTAGALTWYQRAVAVDPDHFPAWDALALLYAAQGAAEDELAAERSALAAFERATGPEPAHLREHAERIERLARALGQVGHGDEAAALSQRAYQLVPSFAAAALAVADLRLAQGEDAAAYAVYDRCLRDHAGGLKLDDRDRLHATFQRGALAAKLGRTEQAIADLREGLRIDPLHAGVLHSLADALAAKGRVAAAIQHYTQALLVVHDAARRGELFARLGRLWEDQLQRGDEAGVCYDLAIAAGVDDHEVMVRALKHYRRSGQQERALQVIERLLPATTEAAQLAALWTERGGILATPGSEANDEERAIEAFDMALSYDPGNQAALAGLSELLERRGDWEQLLQIFEARTESGAAEERADALRALARIAQVHLHDLVRTEKYLKQAVEMAPKKEDYEALLEVYGSDPQRAAERRAAIAGLLGLSGPFMPRVIELGRMLVESGKRRWAWCILSPLMNSTMPDQQLKSMVLELRKEFEKQDNTGALSTETHRELRHPDLPAALMDVLAELDARLTLGRTTTDEVGASGATKLDERTAVGKSFAAVAQKLGLDGAALLRAQEVAEPYAVLDVELPSVVIRAELLQLLSVAETGFLFASMLEQARPGVRLFSVLPQEERDQLGPALLQAVGLAEGTSALADRIRAGVGDEERTRWAEQLREVAHKMVDGPRLRRAALETARRVGLVAAGNLRFVARLLTRIDEALPKMQTVGKMDDLEEFIGAAAPVRTLLGFAATDAFGAAVS